MQNTKVGFVVLHYCAINDTKECVESIQNRIDAASYEIVVVDNFSPDGSGKELEQFYKHNPLVRVILNNANLGFAQGNNVGFKFLKECGCQFIVLLNNDTILIQDNFFEVVEKEYNESHFAALGPLIETPNKSYNGNPGRSYPMSQKELQSTIEYLRNRLFFNRLHLEFLYDGYLFFYYKFSGLRKRLKGAGKVKSKDVFTRQENVQLHGCCLVFSPKYIERYDGLDDRTFLYMEEDILYTQLMKDGMKTVYNPDLKIFHKEDASTNAVFKKGRLKRRFVYINTIQSAAVLEQLINTGNSHTDTN